MIDNFVLALTHGLMLLAAWRLLSRPDLEDDGAAATGPKRRSSKWDRLARRDGADRA